MSIDCGWDCETRCVTGAPADYCPRNEAESRANHHLINSCDVCGDADRDRLAFDMESSMLLCVACKPNRPQLPPQDVFGFEFDPFGEAF